ncbi:hypothetical protein BC830DRAFT_1196364 [Chytriomyces sp. MP71]|nr:hypothetical protein BC830DRAFT_1196364 [Chytriomyces sp. MP71]
MANSKPLSAPPTCVAIAPTYQFCDMPSTAPTTPTTRAAYPARPTGSSEGELYAAQLNPSLRKSTVAKNPVQYDKMDRRLDRMDEKEVCPTTPAIVQREEFSASSFRVLEQTYLQVLNAIMSMMKNAKPLNFPRLAARVGTVSVNDSPVVVTCVDVFVSEEAKDLGNKRNDNDPPETKAQKRNQPLTKRISGNDHLTETGGGPHDSTKPNQAASEMLKPKMQSRASRIPRQEANGNGSCRAVHTEPEEKWLQGSQFDFKWILQTNQNVRASNRLHIVGSILSDSVTHSTPKDMPQKRTALCARQWMLAVPRSSAPILLSQLVLDSTAKGCNSICSATVQHEVVIAAKASAQAITLNLKTCASETSYDPNVKKLETISNCAWQKLRQLIPAPALSLACLFAGSPTPQTTKKIDPQQYFTVLPLSILKYAYYKNYKTIVNGLSNETAVLYQCGTLKPTVPGVAVVVPVTIQNLLGQRNAFKYTTSGKNGKISSPSIQVILATQQPTCSGTSPRALVPPSPLYLQAVKGELASRYGVSYSYTKAGTFWTFPLLTLSSMRLL